MLHHLFLLYCYLAFYLLPFQFSIYMHIKLFIYILIKTSIKKNLLVRFKNVLHPTTSYHIKDYNRILAILKLLFTKINIYLTAILFLIFKMLYSCCNKCYLVFIALFYYFCYIFTSTRFNYQSNSSSCC